MQRQVHEGSRGFRVEGGPHLKKWRTPEERRSLAESGASDLRAQAAAKKLDPGSTPDPAHGQPAGAQNNLLFHQWKKDEE